MICTHSAFGPGAVDAHIRQSDRPPLPVLMYNYHQVLQYFHQVLQYLIVAINKEIYGFPKIRKIQLPLKYYSLQKLVVKLDWYNVLSQLKIYSKPVYSYALEVMLSILKNSYFTTRFSSVSSWHVVRPTSYSSRHTDGPSFFSQCR